jgi:hypothetical protein
MNQRELQHRLVEEDQRIGDDLSAEGRSGTRSELDALLRAKGTVEKRFVSAARPLGGSSRAPAEITR